MNNQGWSLRFMLFLTIIIVLALITASILIAKISSNITDTPSNSNPQNTEIKSLDNTPEKVYTYQEIEESVSSSAQQYFQEKYNNDVGLSTITVQLPVLSEYDSSGELLKSINSKGCDGYVNAYQENGSIIINPYIKCSGYETEGFDEFYLE